MYESYHEKIITNCLLLIYYIMLNLLVRFKHNSKNLDRTLDLYPYRTNQSSVKNIILNSDIRFLKTYLPTLRIEPQISLNMSTYVLTDIISGQPFKLHDWYRYHPHFSSQTHPHIIHPPHHPHFNPIHPHSSLTLISADLSAQNQALSPHVDLGPGSLSYISCMMDCFIIMNRG